MALNRAAKSAVISEVQAQVAKAGVIVVAQYRGLDVEKVTALRKQARASGVYLRVLKNTLVARALDETPFANLQDRLVGPLIYGISVDPVAPAKLLCAFAKTNERLVIVGGAMPNYVLDKAAVQALAAMPSREELLSKLMATMQAPTSTMVRMLNELPTKFVRVVAAVRDQKQTASV